MTLEEYKERMKEWLYRAMDMEKENMDEAQKSAGMDCVGFGMADGAHDAYKNVLDNMFTDFEDL